MQKKSVFRVREGMVCFAAKGSLKTGKSAFQAACEDEAKTELFLARYDFAQKTHQFVYSDKSPAFLQKNAWAFSLFTDSFSSLNLVRSKFSGLYLRASMACSSSALRPKSSMIFWILPVGGALFVADDVVAQRQLGVGRYLNLIDTSCKNCSAKRWSSCESVAKRMVQFR